MAGGEVERFRRRLQLLSQGRLVEAQDMVVGTSAAAKKTGGRVGQGAHAEPAPCPPLGMPPLRSLRGRAGRS